MLTTISYIVFGLLAVGCLCFWTLAYKRRSERMPMFLEREVERNPIGLLDVVIMFSIWLLGQIIAVVILMFVMGVDMETLVDGSVDGMMKSMYVIGVVQLIGTLAAAAAIVFRYGTARSFGWRSDLLGIDFRLGVIGFMLVVPITLLIQAVLTQFWVYEHPTLDMLAKDGGVNAIASAWLMAFIVAPITEEIFFRGVLQKWLQRCFANNERLDLVLVGGHSPQPAKKDEKVAVADLVNAEESVLPRDSNNPYAATTIPTVKTEDNGMPTGSGYWLPIIISSAIFAIAHVGQGPAPIPLFFFSIGLGWVFRQTGSLFPCIVMHMMLNGFSLLMFTLQVIFPEAVPAGVETAPAPG